MEKDKIITEELTEETAPAENAEEKLYSQAELDELLKAEREQLEKKLADAEKLADMSEADRIAYRRELIDKDLAEREARVAKRELIADALDMLEEKGLPKQLAACLNYTGKEECEASINAIGKAFESAVTSAVNERIRGRVPKLSVSCSNDAFLDGLGM